MIALYISGIGNGSTNLGIVVGSDGSTLAVYFHLRNPNQYLSL